MQQQHPSLIHPSAQEALDKLLAHLNTPHAFQDDVSKLLQCVLLCTSDGVPLCRSFAKRDGSTRSSNSENPYHEVMIRNLESIMATFPVMASSQLRPLRGGAVRHVTAFYNDMVLLHVYLHPLVLTFAGGECMNVGAVLSILPKLEKVIEPVRLALLEALQSEVNQQSNNSNNVSHDRYGQQSSYMYGGGMQDYNYNEGSDPMSKGHY